MTNITDNGFIYGLKLKNDPEIRYVGQTSKSIAHRLRGHILRSRRHTQKLTYDLPVYLWIRKHGEQQIDSVEIECVEKQLLDSREIYWIAHYKSKGFRLLNCTSGGQSSFNFSSSFPTRTTKETHGNKGRTHSEEAKALMSIARKSRVTNESTKLLMSMKKRGEQNNSAKLTAKDVLKIRELLSEGIKGVVLAKRYNVTSGAITAIAKRRTWKSI